MSPVKTVRIANGSAFWGDSQEAPLELLLHFLRQLRRGRDCQPHRRQ